MVQFFRNDKKFIHKLATHYLSGVSREDNRYMELIIFMSNLDIIEQRFVFVCTNYSEIYKIY